MKTPAQPDRILLIDALRGSALMGLFLLHGIEHFDFMRYPEHVPAWLKALDDGTLATGFFLFGGKAYAIFACMFGLSFFLMLDRGAQRGRDDRARFAWRLTVLAAIGFLHGLVYCGDILLVLAVLGAPLVLLYRASNRVLLAIAAFFLLQIPSWGTVFTILHSHVEPPFPRHWGIYGRIGEVFAGDSLGATLRTNLADGQLARIWFTIESGRYLQMFGLFLVGLLLGRSRVMSEPNRARRLARWLLAGGVIGFVVLAPLRSYVDHLPLGPMGKYHVGGLVGAYGNLAQMAVWMGGFVLLYHSSRLGGLLRWFAPFGRMSLTNYVTQALVFVPFYYGFGLAMYRHIGPFFSVPISLLFLVVQCTVSHLWLRQFHYGPLEWLWRACTLRSFATPFRRPVPALA